PATRVHAFDHSPVLTVSPEAKGACPMRSQRDSSALLLPTLLVLLSCLVSVQAAVDDKEDDKYQVSARVIRVNFVQGDVSLRRHDSEDWEEARLNAPLVEGDLLATGNDARAEIQIDGRSFVRISSASVLKIVTLRDDGIALSLSEGTATIRLARFDKDHEFFELDAPRITMAAESKGVYRLDAEPKGRIVLTVREGRARIYSDNAGFTVRDGQSAVLNVESEDVSQWQFPSAPAKDSWDDWV